MIWHERVKTSVAGPLIAGVAVLSAGFGGFGTWAATAPISGAVIAPGKIVAEGNNKIVQHLEGGIIKSVFVKEGETVKAGDPLIQFDETAALSNLNQLQLRSLYYQAAAARALAEREGYEAIAFPASFNAYKMSAEARKIIAGQEAEFLARKNSLKTDIAVGDQQIAAMQERIAGYRTQLEEIANQINLMVDERTGFEKLLEKKLIARSRVLDLRRAESDLKSQYAKIHAAIAEANRSIAEIRERLERERKNNVENASKQLNDLRANLVDIREKLRAAQDVNTRSVLRSPASGKVINSSEFNPGAVVTPGQKLMEIVPDDSELIVEARIRPRDVDNIAIGQKAELVLAYATRDVPPVAGKVNYVSADRVDDPRTQEAYYVVHIRFDAVDTYPKTAAQFAPGLPVEAFITTRERTFLSYLAEPISKTIMRSMREN